MITEQKKILVYKFLNRFNDLEKVIKNDIAYYVDKDGKPLFHYWDDNEIETIWFSYERIWSFFDEFFLIEFQEIQEILEDWLEETYKLRGLTPHSLDIFPLYH